MITIEAALQAQLNLKENIPIELFEMYLDSGTRRYTIYSDDLEFPTGSGTVYTSWGIMRGAIRLKLETGLNDVDVSFDNVDTSEFTARFVDDREEFRKRQLKIIRVFGSTTPTNLLSSSIYATPIFDGDMDSPRIDQNWFTVTVKSKVASLNKKCPRRIFSPMCPWEFGGLDCDPTTNLKITKTGVIISGGMERGFHLNNGGSYDTDTFKAGIFTITDSNSDNYNVKRLVASSSQKQDDEMTIQLYHPLPKLRHENGSSFSIATDCDKTKQACLDKNNILNFGGFLYAVKGWIGKRLILGY